MIRKLLTGIAALAASLCATTARAEWHQATSSNFIVYSEGTGLLKLLGKLYIRLASWLSYAY